MKLVDILARELAEWPVKEGVYHPGQDYCVQSDKCSQVFFCGTHGKILLSRRADKTSGVRVTRAEWQAAVDALNADKCEHSYANNIGCPECGELNAPKVVEWDGVGDPPVGVVCQYSVLNGPWYTCEVGYSFFDGEHRCFVIKCKHLGFEQVCRIDPGSEGSVEFRPFRTAEQVAAEEREAEDNEVMSRYMSLSDCQKGILGHSPERAIIGLMRVMGYSKEPKPCGS